MSMNDNGGGLIETIGRFLGGSVARKTGSLRLGVLNTLLKGWGGVKKPHALIAAFSLNIRLLLIIGLLHFGCNVLRVGFRALYSKHTFPHHLMLQLS